MNNQKNIFSQEIFEDRHHGAKQEDIQKMLDTIGVDSIEQLIKETIPEKIRLEKGLDLPAPMSETDFLEHFQALADQNELFKNFIGTGYYDCHTPKVILRNILENPSWYTAYTPYQAEIAQGRLEALINFQTMVIELTGMQIANASLLDEATAAAEAMAMLFHQRKGDRKKVFKFFVSEKCFPQTIDVLKTRATPIGIELVIGDHKNIKVEDYFAVMLQYPDSDGNVEDYTALINKAKEIGVTSVVAADLLSLTLLTPPGEMGADVVVGTTQRMGIPMGYGGPHAAYFATHEKFKRNIPGRIIGISKDANGDKAYRMALQTREQHIRREKATSNICTSQVLLAVMAGMYAVYHGPDGLRNIGRRIHGLTQVLAKGLEEMNLSFNPSYFDTLTVKVSDIEKVRKEALAQKVNFAYKEGHISISLDETKKLADVALIFDIIAKAEGKSTPNTQEIANGITVSSLPKANVRTSKFLMHPVFAQYHTEHEILRYMKHLESKDLSLVHSMISLGSCTMKLNSTSEMIPVSWPTIGSLHPFIPKDQAKGYTQILSNLSKWLEVITGFDATSLQPNSGAQGEYAGLMAIRSFLLSQAGGEARNIALIPASAHGTNPASAVMAGMKVVVVKTDEKGNIDVEDLKEKAVQYKETLACLMVTYPSTHGVFEESIKDVCNIIHENGGQVYMDGANMNAQVGITSPGTIGADVCHLNLHKTFCIPHGGGGPGMGPICVKAHLKPHLAAHSVVDLETGTSAISAAPFGSASILPISYAYIAMMGPEGLTNATKMAILNANYIKERISKSYEILYTGTNGRAAHEMIVDCRAFKSFGVEVEDIAKRLMDYGFHAPTVSFPVAGTLMIEPTESESKAELDRFCDALISIRKEIEEIEQGKYKKEDNLLKNAPHTLKMVTATEWTFDYSREQAAYPLPFVKERKFWASVRRIDSAYGDRNLMCSCISTEDYMED